MSPPSVLDRGNTVPLPSPDRRLCIWPIIQKMDLFLITTHDFKRCQSSKISKKLSHNGMFSSKNHHYSNALKIGKSKVSKLYTRRFAQEQSLNCNHIRRLRSHSFFKLRSSNFFRLFFTDFHNFT